MSMSGPEVLLVRRVLYGDRARGDGPVCERERESEGHRVLVHTSVSLYPVKITDIAVVR
jgi:hypothetical protein